MADKSKIEYVDATWNPVAGCCKISDGCLNCYAERYAGRLCKIPGPIGEQYSRVVTTTSPNNGDGIPKWNGEFFTSETQMDRPNEWLRARRIFVCSMGDLFLEAIPDCVRDVIFSVMFGSPQHEYLLLTKRPHLMKKYFLHLEDLCMEIGDPVRWSWLNQPNDNIILGVTIENQKAAVLREMTLLQIPAARRWISFEPLLSDISLPVVGRVIGKLIHWCIIGPETGPGRRPCDIRWVRALVAQMKKLEVPVLIKKLEVEGQILKRGQDGSYPRAWPEDLRLAEGPRAAEKERDEK
jgi:protein gp37